jgi:hypothetical protein
MNMEEARSTETSVNYRTTWMAFFTGIAESICPRYVKIFFFYSRDPSSLPSVTFSDQQFTRNKKQKQIPWPETASELY